MKHGLSLGTLPPLDDHYGQRTIIPFPGTELEMGYSVAGHRLRFRGLEHVGLCSVHVACVVASFELHCFGEAG